MTVGGQTLICPSVFPKDDVLKRPQSKDTEFTVTQAAIREFRVFFSKNENQTDQTWKVQTAKSNFLTW